MEPLPPHLQAIDDRVPDDPPRSKLAAFAPLILRWRRRGKPFQRIAVLLQLECNLQISAEGVRKFVKAQARKRTKASAAEETPVAAQTSSQTSPPRPSKEDFAEMRKRIQELRNAPPPPPKENKKIFVFDESKPITKGPQPSD